MKSTKYKTWNAILDFKTCVDCRSRHGKIYLSDELIDPTPPLHPNCRCEIEWLKALLAGTATKHGINGADWCLKNTGTLPDYYISWADAKKLGFKPILGNLNQVAPGKMITRGVYHNANGHLPSAPGRVWYEADINYNWGYRGSERILFSNDGLIFVTYDHYLTFQEIA